MSSELFHISILTLHTTPTNQKPEIESPLKLPMLVVFSFSSNSAVSALVLFGAGGRRSKHTLHQ